MSEQNNDKPKGVPEGVKLDDLDPSQLGGGPKLPEDTGVKAPVKEPTAEEKVATEAAEKKAADEAAAKTAADEAEAAKKKAEEEANKSPLAEFPVYGDEVADSVTELLKESGVTAAEAEAFFKEAVEKDDLSKVDVAKLTEKLGKAKATLVMNGLKDYYNRNAAAVKEVVDAVYSVTGGEKEFSVLKTWATEKEKTDPAFAKDMNEYRKLLDGTATQARLAAQELVKQYNADPKTKSLTIKMVTGDKSGSADLGLEYISRADYVTALKTADDKKDFAEVARLRARRSESMKQERKR